MSGRFFFCPAGEDMKPVSGPSGQEDEMGRCEKQISKPQERYFNHYIGFIEICRIRHWKKYPASYTVVSVQ
jgi:hypothetical protein